MAETISDVMTRDPVTLDAGSPVVEAAKRMKEQGIGDVIVLDGGKVCGILTDRDIVVRAIASGMDLSATTVGSICSSEVTALKPDDTIDSALRVMRERAIRRLPVVKGGKAVGVVSIGDLALEKDPSSALADISGAMPNT